MMIVMMMMMMMMTPFSMTTFERIWLLRPLTTLFELSFQKNCSCPCPAVLVGLVVAEFDVVKGLDDQGNCLLKSFGVGRLGWYHYHYFVMFHHQW